MSPRPQPTQPPRSSPMKVILVGVEMPCNGSVPMEAALRELEGLATTANYLPVATLTQRLSTVNPHSLLGSGKVEELKHAVHHHEAGLVIFDEALTPTQNRNLERQLECRVIDRPWLILEIFLNHARTREAKTQVELARLKYALPRLTKLWGHLSRQKGGIGLREVGEKQIQLDRRYIRSQIHRLEGKLKEIDRDKKNQRKSRKDVFQVSLVGYTNVGKSTLMNRLTGAGTLVADKLFATLDATVRRIQKNYPYPVLLVDTVGLIDKLPHDLVASFKSTLDEVREADLLLKVVDPTHPNFRDQMKTTETVLTEMGADRLDSILVFNKIDQIADPERIKDLHAIYPEALLISCKTGEGIEELRKGIDRCYDKHLVNYRLDLDYTQSHLLPALRKLAIIVKEEFAEDKIHLSLRVPPEKKSQIESLLNLPASPAPA
ncbi:MAG: GTPase HflX [Nitrospinae bacterium CG11_big_fil_rev_8_21_14_0_20_56_8]|nr:MAG: GTPase HflX [Nitrospinae bacterium CG11_big_fil_rev_8_21_14_0_20_56_8]